LKRGLLAGGATQGGEGVRTGCREKEGDSPCKRRKGWGRGEKSPLGGRLPTP